MRGYGFCASSRAVLFRRFGRRPTQVDRCRSRASVKYRPRASDVRASMGVTSIRAPAGSIRDAVEESSIFSNRLVDRFGTARMIAVTMSVMAVGYLLFLRLDTTPSYVA